jgi:hypothetical protein
MWTRWKSIFRVNDILVFVVNTRVINRLFKCEGLLVNARRLSAPQKWKDWSNEDLDFRLCNLGLRTIKRGCSMKSWGEIILGRNTYTPLQFVGENSPEILLLEIFWAETPTWKGQRLWFCERNRPPKLVFHPSGARLWSRSGVSKETSRRLRVFAPASQRLRSLQARESNPYSLETPQLVDPNG